VGRDYIFLAMSEAQLGGKDLGLNEISRKIYEFMSNVLGVRAYDVMEPPVTITPDKSVTEAAKVMDENDSGAVIVVDEKRSVKGILTYRDIVTRVVARELDPQKVRVGDVMTERVYMARVDAPLDYIAGLMIKEGVRRIPIVNRMGRLVGIVEAKDLLGVFGMQRDLMVRVVSLLEAELAKHAEEAKERRREEDEEGAMYV